MRQYDIEKHGAGEGRRGRSGSQGQVARKVDIKLLCKLPAMAGTMGGGGHELVISSSH